NKYLRLSEKGIEIFKIHKEQQEYIEKSIFSVLNNYSEVELKTVVKLMDDIEKVWGELPW
ncbi:transcriptional regulator, partial [Streptococcus pneumoniae]